MVEAVDKPVNVLISFLPGVTLDELGALGVRRVSLGSALANAATGALLRAAEETLTNRTFDWLDDVAPGARIRELLGP